MSSIGRSFPRLIMESGREATGVAREQLAGYDWVSGRTGRTAFLETSLSSSSLLASMNSLRRLGKLA